MVSKIRKVCIGITVAVSLVGVSVLGLAAVTSGESKSLGVKAVMLMYNFDTIEQLSEQMAELREITTPEIYEELTIDNEDRTLNTYLKFRGNPVTVSIIKATGDYVMYSLTSESIGTDRIFMFLYETDNQKINYVREVECIDFVETYR